jgi:hypothetical protein
MPEGQPLRSNDDTRSPVPQIKLYFPRFDVDKTGVTHQLFDAIATGMDLPFGRQFIEIFVILRLVQKKV